MTRWVGDRMYKIMRLALANIRRHKSESILLGILIMLCMALLGGAIPAEKSANRIFPELWERTGFCKALIALKDEVDPELALEVLKEDDRVEDGQILHYLYGPSARILDKNGDESLFPCTFIDVENEEIFEDFALQSKLTDQQIAELEHPIIVPLNEKKRLELTEGDSFSVIDGAKRFTFTVAGFYESGYFYDTKFIVSDGDIAMLKNVFERCTDLAFDPKEGADLTDISKKWEERASALGLDVESAACIGMDDWSSNFYIEIFYVLKITEVLALIILIAIVIVIGFRVVTDIKEQIVQIGVLEALGYRSGEIALAYAAEYFLITLAGCIFGALLSMGVFSALIRIFEGLKGYPVSHSADPLSLGIVFAVILLVVTLLAWIKARSVRKYPPVLAFRKGIGDHHFGKSRFPLRNAKGSVHLRLALKGFSSHIRQNIALTLVTGVTVTAVVLSFILYSFMGNGLDLAFSIAGCEMADASVTVMPETDPEEFVRDVEALPEVRKVLPASSMGSIFLDAYELNDSFMANVYADYSQTENIHPIKGRFPEHDNELMVTKAVSTASDLDTGDTIRLEYGSIRREYIVTGVVTALINSNSVYLTEEGMKQLDPFYTPTEFQIFKSEGTTYKELKETLDSRYGKSAGDLGQTDSSQGSCEERIRKRADQVISAMLEQSGATHVEYSIQVGNQVIGGSSSSIRIRSSFDMIQLLTSYMEQLCQTVSITTRLFMVISAAVVMMILSMLMSGEIRRRRRELGIMKGMGYTSKELMLQLALQIMPAVIMATFLGTAVSLLGVKLIAGFVGNIPISVPSVLALDLAVIAFCFGCAYLGARKIKKISVYELMTE